MNLREALESVYEQHGQLTPALVVEVAAAKDTPAGELLHGRLNWDDASAASAYRLHQAHELIASVRVVYKEATDKKPEKSVRAFHAMRGPDGYVYEPAEKIAADPFASKVLLAEMEREWRALQKRWKDFPEFVALVRADVEGAEAIAA